MPALIFCLLLVFAALLPAAYGQEGAVDAPKASPIAEALDPLLEARLFSSASVGIQVVDVDSGEEVWSHQPDVALVPASVTKVLTAAVALRTLGSGFRFQTDVLGGGEISPEGVLQGNLYVLGGGDPTLVVEDIWKIQRDLGTLGIVEIDGSLVFDDTGYSDNGLIPGWNKGVDEANGPAYFAPLGALSVNQNTTCLVIGPAAEAGLPARVDLETPSAAVEIINQTTTGSARSRAWLKVEREVSKDGLSVAFTVSGNVPLGAESSRVYRSIADPTAHFISVFERMLKDRGVKWKGKAVRGTVPSDAVLLVRHRSDALNSVLSVMNKQSSNIVAEQVLKTVGGASSRAPGSTTSGIEVMAGYLESLGVPRGEFNLVNGSGLSRDILMRPSHLTAVLVDLYHDKRVGPEFQASLAVAGVDGTLRRRLGSGDAAMMRGKTGSLNSVFCLAGYIHAGDGRTYAFAFLVNGFSGSTSPVRALQDRFTEALLALPPRSGETAP